MNYELSALFFASLLSSTLLPGGSEIALALLVNQQNYQLWLLVCLATAGNTLGSYITFAMGCAIAHFYPARSLINHKRKWANQLLSSRGSVVLLLSWVPVIGDPLCLLAGWLRLSLLPSLVFILLGKTLRYVAVAYLFV